MSKLSSPNKKEIARSFSMAATTYDAASFVQKEIGCRLLERLALLKSPPSTILDVGAGTGFLTRVLQQKYPKSHIIGLDLAQGMSTFAKKNQPWHLWKNKPFYVCGDTEFLPFANNSFDLIFSNFTLQWCFNLNQVFSEFKRVLKPNGMIFFTTLGPQTLTELRACFEQASNHIHINEFTDMHDIGDSLLNAQFSDPVIDMEIITATYPDVKQILSDLKATGARNMNQQRSKGITGKQTFNRMCDAYNAYRRSDGAYPVSYEVIYGHAWLKESQIFGKDEDGLVRIPGDRIPRLKAFS